jgi:hypothetical protein
MSRWVLPCWLLLTACSETEPCWGLEKGHTYFVDVLSAYGPESEYEWVPPPNQTNRPSCGLNVDIEIGATLGFEIVEYRTDEPAASCLKSGARVSGLIGVEVPVGSIRIGPPVDRIGSVYASRTVEIKGCPATWGIQLVGIGEGAPFAAPVPGRSPPVVLVRVIYPDPESPECIALFGDSPALCADEFVVQVRKN